MGDSAGLKAPRVGIFRERPGSDILKQGVLRKMKKVHLHMTTLKKKYFILRSTSTSGPARLEYYDSEKKFKANSAPKKSIHLHKCFNINKRVDAKHKFSIALFLDTECFTVIAEDQVEQETWLNLMLEYQNEFLLDGEVRRIHYDLVWQGVIKHKSPTSCSRIMGPYRFCLSDKAVCLVKIGEILPSYTFQFTSVRRCGHSDNFFFIEVGRSAVTGSGEIWIQVDDTATAQSMHDAVLTEMSASRASSQDHFRRRSNTSSSTCMSNRNTVHGDEPFHRKRATSESHQMQGSPRRNRSLVQRPKSSVMYPKHAVLSSELTTIPLGSSPISSVYDQGFLMGVRVRTDSMGSRSSRTSHTDAVDANMDMSAGTPVITPENSFCNIRSGTPETSYSISEECNSDEPISSSDYLPMTPGQRSMTPSPTRSQGHLERVPSGNDYLAMTPGHRSGTPSPTRHMDRPGSAASDSHESATHSEGYMDMRPSSLVSSPASTGNYMDMHPVGTPGKSEGYTDMTPGHRTPSDPGPGYMVMEGTWVRTTAPIPIRANKEPGYIDMGPSSQPLPTVKEGGSGEAYLPMSPSGQSPINSVGLKPAKVFSYLSDDSMSGEFPKRAYSVGSRPTPKPTHRVHQHPEPLRRQPLDSSKSSSAPHLIAQKHRSPYMDSLLCKNPYLDSSSCGGSSLSQSIRSDDSDSFMEMDFYRPRTASDSYGCRPRSSSFGKQLLQGHRPRSSSYGQGSKVKISKLAAGLRTDSFDSVRTTSQEFNKKRSQESLGKFSSSSRNSSSESLKRLPEDMAKKCVITSEYMDMAFDKRKTPSPNVQGVVSPKTDPTGYVDMTLGTSAPKSIPRGMSPSSSGNSLSLGSSPASSLGHPEKVMETKVIMASGKVIPNHGFGGAASDHQLKVSLNRLKVADKRSPSSSGKESEDESYVPFQPVPGAGIGLDDAQYRSQGGGYDPGYRSHPGIKVQHGHSRSLDSAMKSPESGKSKSQFKFQKGKKDSKHKSKKAEDDHIKKGKSDKHDSKHKVMDRLTHSAETPKIKQQDSVSTIHPGLSNSSLMSKVTKGFSPVLDRKIELIPDTDLFSNKIFSEIALVSESKGTGSTSVGVSHSKQLPADSAGYMEYCPGTQTTQDGTKPSGGAEGPAPHSVRPQKLVEREYMEIDLPRQHATGESDYMEANPSALGTMASPGSAANAYGLNENFSYMDYNPADRYGAGEPGAQCDVIKAPAKVVSYFVAQTPEVESLSISADSSSAVVQSKRDSAEKDVGGENIAGVDTNSVGRENLVGTDNDQMVKPHDAQSVGSSQGSPVADKKSVMHEVRGKENKAPAKIVIKQTLSMKQDIEPIQDEGYCDLDLSKSQRSESSSSTNSDRSRRQVEGGGMPEEDEIPCPETPVSYICDDSEHLSDTGSLSGSVKEPLSPFKQQPKPSVLPKQPLNTTGAFTYLDDTQKVTVPVANPQNASQVAGNALSRQCSVPMQPLSGGKMGSERSRKSSGPPNFPSAAKGGSDVGSGALGNVSKRQVLEPSTSCQELMKQKSMPCMNVPMNLDRARTTETMKEGVQSRHSFTDLSQYEEMSFPGNELRKSADSSKSNSQQQLSDSSGDTKLNYAELDIGGSSENIDDKSPRVKSRHPSSVEDITQSVPPTSYAEIDYIKTAENANNKEPKFTIQ